MEEKGDKIRGCGSYEVLTLARFKPGICLINYVKTALAAHNSVVTMALAQ
jgi:hypothetical protein